MARTNKYTSLNFNDIYEKKFNTSSSSSAKSNSNNNGGDHKKQPILSNSRIQGHMLVLTRPTPKPISIPVPNPLQKQEKQTFSSTPPDQTRSEPDLISLRPQGRTGSGPSLGSSSGRPISPLTSPSPSPFKTNKFVPPHLRPGFVGREEKPGPGGKGVGLGRASIGSSANQYGEDGRPKSGGGYERMRRGVGGGGGGGFVGGVVDPVDVMNRPGSVGARPSTSG